jgi:hypothetical protein
MTLLDDAKALPVEANAQRSPDPEVVELALAWLRGEITTRQAAGALKCSQHNVYTRMASALRSAVGARMIELRILTERRRAHDKT